jgi:acetyl esterase
MKIDSQVELLLASTAARGLPPTEQLTPVEARAHAEKRNRARAAGQVPLTVGSVFDTIVPGPAGDVPVRVYQPDGEAPCCTVVYLHGGGWVLGSVEGWDPIARLICQTIPATVVSVDYRLAPENPYPAALEDAWAAVTWAYARRADLGPGGLVVAGDSAGGNLAAACALRAVSIGPGLAAQLLFYPVVDGTTERASYTEHGDAAPLSAAAMRWFWDKYARLDVRDDRMVSPIRASDLGGVAPAVVVTAEFDPLRDEGADYAEALRAAGVTVRYLHQPTMVHGFLGMAGGSDAARAALLDACAAVRNFVLA